MYALITSSLLLKVFLIFTLEFACKDYECNPSMKTTKQHETENLWGRKNLCKICSLIRLARRMQHNSISALTSPQLRKDAAGEEPSAMMAKTNIYTDIFKKMNPPVIYSQEVGNVLHTSSELLLTWGCGDTLSWGLNPSAWSHGHRGEEIYRPLFQLFFLMCSMHNAFSKWMSIFSAPDQSCTL